MVTVTVLFSHIPVFLSGHTISMCYFAEKGLTFILEHAMVHHHVKAYSSNSAKDHTKEISLQGRKGDSN